MSVRVIAVAAATRRRWPRGRPRAAAPLHVHPDYGYDINDTLPVPLAVHGRVV